jgi:hypothetical protein
MNTGICLLAFVLGSSLGSSLLQGQVAPDASGIGPLGVSLFAYTSGAAHTDAEVLPGCMTNASYDCKIQLTGLVYLPNPMLGRHPLIIMLHGNHATCGHFYNPPPGGTDPAGLPGSPRVDSGAGAIRFTGTGTCTGANPIVVPSFKGYNYLGMKLASWGYIVVSMNANRGIALPRGAPGVPGDTTLIRARGVLVLQTLALLRGWDINGGPPGSIAEMLQARIDFSNVGLMGHSRGGEGVRAAYNLFNGTTRTPSGADPTTHLPIFYATNPWTTRLFGMNIRAIYEIAPTDAGMVNLPVATPPASTFFNARGTVWNVLLPMCDGDVSRLSGVRPFDRMIMNLEPTPIQKSTYTVWGTNHNFYNTEWMVTDPFSAAVAPSIICRGTGNTAIYPLSPGSVSQQSVAISSVVALFRGNVGIGLLPAASANVSFNQNFDPPFGIPAQTTKVAFPTRVDRGYSPPGVFQTFDDFTTAGFNSTAPTVPDLTVNVTATYGTVPDHDPVISQAARINWTTAGTGNFFQTSWTANGVAGIDITGGGYQTLDLRVSRQDSTDNAPTTDFSISLVGANGVMTRSLLLSKYIDPNFAGTVATRKSNLTGPVGSTVELHPILQTVRIPLTDFGNYAFIAPQLHGVRLIFDQTTKGAIYVTNIRLSTQIGGGAATYPPHPDPPDPPAAAQDETPPPAPVVHGCRVLSVAAEAGAWELGGDPGYRILVQSADGEFPIRNEAPIMVIGTGDAPPLSNAVTVSLGDEPMVEDEQGFTLTTGQYQGLPAAAHVVVQFGDAPQPAEYWDCGSLH